MELAILSDTHVPSRASRLPEWVEDRVAAADHVVHAGDFDSAETLARIRDLADGNLTAVAGNMDPPSLDLPRVATVEAADVSLVITHGHGGSRSDSPTHVASVVLDHGDEGAVGVSGHTHDPMDREIEGIRLLNPGSATGAFPAHEQTMMTAVVVDGTIDATLHRG